GEGLPCGEGRGRRAGAGVPGDERAETDTGWARVTAGPWLEQTLKELRAPDGDGVDPGPALRGTLRPYQKAGTRWMDLLAGLGLGACLADDMGLGKTIQVLSLLLVEQARGASPRPSLLVAPASLLANWAAEIEKFAPGLKAAIVHPSAIPADQVKAFNTEQASDYDLAITSYGSLLRIPVFAEVDWRVVILV